VSLEEEWSSENLKEHSGIRIVELESTPLGQRSTQVRIDPKETTWLVFTKDPTHREENARTAEWLKSHIIDKNTPIVNVTGLDGNVELWGLVFLDEAGIEEARKQAWCQQCNRESGSSGI
jgi:hypothetical protein